MFWTRFPALATGDVIINSTTRYRYTTELPRFCRFQFRCLSPQRGSKYAGDNGLRFFRVYKNSRPNWDANSWQKVPRLDAISLRHLPRRSSENCELHSANVARQTDRLKTNYSVDIPLIFSLNANTASHSFLGTFVLISQNIYFKNLDISIA